MEGLITAAVLVFVYQTRPELLEVTGDRETRPASWSVRKVLICLAVFALLVGGIGSQFASSHPDGLEWALFGNEEAGYNANMGLDEENYGKSGSVSEAAEAVQEKTAFLPDYAFANDEENAVGTSVSGIVGSLIVAGVAIGISAAAGFYRRRKAAGA